MAAILLAACPFRGHVTPTVALAGALLEAGHDVRVLTGSRWADAVSAVGARHLPLPHEADIDETSLIDRFPERATLRGPAAPRFDMTRIFLDPMPSQLVAVDAALAEEPADVIVAEPLFLAALPLVGRADAPPVLTLGTMPMLVTNPAIPPVGPPLDVLGPLAPRAHRLAHRAGQRVLFGPVQRHAEALLREIGEGSPAGFFLDWPLHGAGIIQLSVPSFEPADLPVPVHHVGSLRRPGPAPEPPLWWPRVLEARAAGTPVVHVTQGTVANTDPEMLLAPTLRALAERPVLVVATTGGLPVESMDLPVTDNAIVTDWVAYDLLLPQTALLVTNGGYGGVHEALRHGVPVVLIGAQQDKAAVGARVRRAGVGQALTTLSPSEEALDRAVGEVLHEPAYGRAARAVAAELASASGRQGAVDAVVAAAGGRSALAL